MEKIFLFAWAMILISVPLLILPLKHKLYELHSSLWYRKPTSQAAIGGILELAKRQKVETETLAMIHELEDKAYVSQLQAERLLLALFNANSKEEALRKLRRVDMAVDPLSEREKKRLKRLSIIFRGTKTSENLHVLADIDRIESHRKESDESLR